MTEIRKQYDDIKKRLENRTEENYSMAEIQVLANDILKATSYYNYKGATPIVRILKEFGITPYKEMLEAGVSGKLLINGNTKEIYNVNPIILVNKKDDLYYQRFVAARELACFLLNYLGSEKYQENSFFSDIHYYTGRTSLKNEQAVERFATTILMPEELYRQEYIRASRKSKGNIIFVSIYLTRFFEVPTYLVERRVKEILNY